MHFFTKKVAINLHISKKVRKNLRISEIFRTFAVEFSFFLVRLIESDYQSLPQEGHPIELSSTPGHWMRLYQVLQRGALSFFIFISWQ